MMPARYIPLGKVYVWRIEGQAYYTEDRDDSPPNAEAAERYLVVKRDRQYEVVCIDPGGRGEFIRDAMRVE